MPMIPMEIPDPFKGTFSEEEVNDFGLNKLSVNEAKKLALWIRDTKEIGTPQTETKTEPIFLEPLFNETIQSIDFKTNSLLLLDNSLWEFSDSASETSTSWFPGQRVSILPGTDSDYPYLIQNTSSLSKINGIYVEGSSRSFTTLQPSFHLASPVTAAVIVQLDQDSGRFSMNDRTMWEISPADFKKIKEIHTPTDVRFQKSFRKGFPFTFMDASSYVYFSAKPRFIIQSSTGGFSSNELKQLSSNLNSGGVIVLSDESRWEIYPSNQEISFSWKEGDLFETKKSKRQDFPIILINQSEGTSALAKPFLPKETKLYVPKIRMPTVKEQAITKVTNYGRYLYLTDGTSYKITAIDRGIVDLWLPDHKIEITNTNDANSLYKRIKNLSIHESVRGKRM